MTPSTGLITADVAQYTAAIVPTARPVEYRSSTPTSVFGMVAPMAKLQPVPLSTKTLYDPRIAYITSVASAWAYANGQTMADELAYYGLRDCTVREHAMLNPAMLIVATTFFVRSECGRVGVLVFRGTQPDNFINWLANADTELLPFHYGRVHSGFFHNVEPLWNDIKETVEGAMKGDGNRKPLETLYITGHSLGGAMAVVAAARIFTSEYAHWQPLLQGVYTFGQPMVGDRTFANYYERQIKLYRHVYRKDVVPHLPPHEVGDFHHFGEEFFSADKDKAWQNTDPPRTVACAFTAAAMGSAFADFFVRRLLRLRWIHLPYSVDDHRPDGYVGSSRAALA